MKRYPKRSELLKTLHRGFVWTCIGATGLGLVLTSTRWYNYLSLVKPQLQEKQEAEKQKLLAEGSSDRLQDVAPTVAA